MGHITIEKTIKEKIEVVPCIKCKSENITVGDMGYSTFNIAFGKCKDCEHEILIDPCGYNCTKEDIIKEWNRRNDPHIMIMEYQKKINGLQFKIDEIKKIHNIN